MIAGAGGLSFLAHPGMMVNGKELSMMITLGIDGIETVHPSHTAEIQRYYKGIVDQYYLLECGGSDFHGGLRNDDRNFGQYGISFDAVERMHQRLGC
jgi:predicted metal-dependent phosphoesterase TrpH